MDFDADIIKKANEAAERVYYFTATPGEYSLNTLVKYDFKAPGRFFGIVNNILHILGLTGHSKILILYM